MLKSRLSYQGLRIPDQEEKQCGVPREGEKKAKQKLPAQSKGKGLKRK
jgi:hypothetical protein